MAKNELLSVSENTATLDNNVEMGAYCSLSCTTKEEKKLIFNATASPDKMLRECCNMEIPMTALYVEKVQLTDEETGELQECNRMVIIDKDGKSYACVSSGAFNAMRRIIGLYGTPDTWDEPLVIMPALITKDKNQILTIKIV